MHELIHDIALCIIAAWALGVLAQFLHQPVILAYLVGGFAIGPAGFGLVEGQESVSIISELGLIFLLFMLGREHLDVPNSRPALENFPRTDLASPRDTR